MCVYNVDVYKGMVSIIGENTTNDQLFKKLTHFESIMLTWSSVWSMDCTTLVLGASRITYTVYGILYDVWRQLFSRLVIGKSIYIYVCVCVCAYTIEKLLFCSKLSVTSTSKISIFIH